jgi:hypothetical protein
MSLRFRCASSSCSSFSQWMKSPAKWMALTPRWVIEEWASTPVKVATMPPPAFCALTTPIMVGSPTITACGAGHAADQPLGQRRAPRQPISSS